MSLETDNLVVASGGSVFVAPVGTAAPTDPDATPSSSWTEVGLISEEGATFTRGITVEEFNSWQRRLAVRRDVTAEEVMASFTLQEWKEDTFTLAFGGGEVTDQGGGVYKYEFPTGDSDLDERALLIRWDDNEKHYQIAFDRGSVTEPVEVTLNRTSLAQLPISFKALASEDEDTIGVSFLTDDPSFTPGS
jgi:hypothetical protein